MHRTLLTLALGTGAFLSGLPGHAEAQSLTAELVASGFSSPLYVVSPPNDFDRLFVVERGGQIKIIKNGATLATPFLNISGIVQSGGEQGLLGLAFHPDYENNGRFFVNYTNTSGNTRVTEYQVSGGNPDVADPTEVQLIFGVNQPFSNHNGGCIQFGPLGKLFIGTGDGGSGNDPGNRAQNPLNNLGKMLRLDVDIPAPFHPADNPFISDPNVNNTIWALGMRNPWRFSFDQANGDLYIGDVGQGAVEETDYVAAPSPGGMNFGWRCMEGNNCTGLSGCTCNSIALTGPVHSYANSGSNCSMTGGFVYRSAEIPALQGTYFFGDYCSSNIWSFRLVSGVVTEFTNRTAELEPAGAPTINNITSFGQDAAGNVYICDFGGGEIYKIAGDCNTSNYCTATANSSGQPASINSSGTPSVGTNAFTLRAQNCPPNVFGIFYYGNAQVQTTFGDGFRCVGATSGGTIRLQGPIQVDGAGNIVRPLDFTAPPAVAGAGQILPGSTWNFQFWYRDLAAGGAGFNLTDGLAVTFCP